MSKEPVHDGPLGDLQAALRRLVWATIVVYSVLVLLGAFVWVSSTVQRNEIARVAKQTNAALCTLRHDFEQRVEASRQFLRDHPDGVGGITPEDIQRSIDGLQTTINALAILDCSAPLAERTTL